MTSEASDLVELLHHAFTIRLVAWSERETIEEEEGGGGKAAIDWPAIFSFGVNFFLFFRSL